jgi:hypothetical protein
MSGGDYLDILLPEWEKFYYKLENDVILLQKLLYRNKHQHKSTLVYQYMKIIHRSISQITKIWLDYLRKAILDCLSFAEETKITSVIIEKLISLFV